MESNFQPWEASVRFQTVEGFASVVDQSEEALLELKQPV